ncbi:hypothetical protein [Geomicrobium sp. JCM 19039]|uniref:hypothetical protein n=1 Tax=Geomicrobium sp. JCM 19039 TaxID=1460636 RepID=UPI00045F1DD3|nr:hypothetical protein [Geomicrobium sp. JCM 19039]GAK12494.1 hypothetical protein JCM19039_2275 [Geomicrobium sp. JCM 19039]
MLLVLFWGIVIASIFLTVRRKQPIYLGVPIAAIGLYLFVSIIQVPLSFRETITFIFGLR